VCLGRKTAVAFCVFRFQKESQSIADVISKCPHESFGEIMQLMDVVEIKCVPRQEGVVNCGVHVIPNCVSPAVTPGRCHTALYLSARQGHIYAPAEGG
jgi:hypothetical protein